MRQREAGDVPVPTEDSPFMRYRKTTRLHSPAGAQGSDREASRHWAGWSVPGMGAICRCLLKPLRRCVLSNLRNQGANEERRYIGTLTAEKAHMV